LEELAEVETKAFDLDPGWPAAVAAAESEQPWVAYWQLPPNGIQTKLRPQARASRGR
jgi:hypothetical protein